MRAVACLATALPTWPSQGEQASLAVQPQAASSWGVRPPGGVNTACREEALPKEAEEQS